MHQQFFNIGQRDGNLSLHTAVWKHKITNGIEVFGNQRTVWGGDAVGVVGTKTACVEEKKEEANNSHKFASVWR